MKKIYAKFVKDRQKEFQIETAIWKDEDKILVEKRNLYKEGITHIKKMYDTYQLYKDKDILCESFLEENEKNKKIFFEYMQGKTMEQCLMEAFKSKNIQNINNIVQAYSNILDVVCNEEWFADGGYKNVIFDLTFDNLILNENKWKVIDYEWRFEVPIEKEFIVFRAVFAFYMKHAGVVKLLYTEEQLYELFKVSLEKKEQYIEANQKFIDFVYGANGYHKVLEPYKKTTMSVCEEDVIRFMKITTQNINGQETIEDVVLNGILSLIQKNKLLYDDSEKFFSSTKKLQAEHMSGFLMTELFRDEIINYINGNYDMIHYYKNQVSGKEEVIQYMAETIREKDEKCLELYQQVQYKDEQYISLNEKYNVDCDNMQKRICQLEEELNYIKSCKAYHIFLEKKVKEYFE